MEETFGINNVASSTASRAPWPQRAPVYLHRAPRRRHPPAQRVPSQEAPDRLHLVDGILIALLNIDEVIQVIRTSDDSAAAKQRLCQVFD